MSLVEALKLVKLGPGRTSCRVNGWEVEVRVQPAPAVEPVKKEDESETSLYEENMMLEPWVELPGPEPTFSGFAKPGPLPQPDLPEIPSEEEEL